MTTTLLILVFSLLTLCVMVWTVMRTQTQMMTRAREMEENTRAESLVRAIGEVTTSLLYGNRPLASEEKEVEEPPVLAWNDPLIRNEGEVGDTLSREEMDQVEEMLYQAQNQKVAPEEEK